MKKVTASEIVIFVYDGMGKLAAEYSTATPPTNPTTNYTATDPLGSPRVITNKLGEIVSRRDFMPFGEQLAPDATYRTASLKYSSGDNIRQKFTGYERDEETGLDFAEARYYNNKHGRFTAIDPLLASGKSANPQTFNRYVYTMNRPLILTDETGLQAGKKTKPKTEQTQPTDIPKKGYYIDFTGGGAKLTGQEVTSGGKNFGPQYGAVFLINPIVYKDGKVVKADNVTISETVKQGPITVNGPNGTRVPASNDLKDNIEAKDSVGEKIKTSAPEGIQDIRGLTATTQEDSDYQRSIGLESTVTNTFNVEVNGKLVVSRSITTTSSADVVKVTVGPNVPAPVAKPPVVTKPKKGPNEEE